MSRAEILRQLLLAWCAMLLLAGCATPRLSREPLSALAQEELLRNLPGFRFDGRAAVPQIGSPKLSWRQSGEESQLRLGSPLVGAGNLTLVYSPATLRVASSRGDEFEGADAARFLNEQLGFMPPFEALRYWVLGLAAPGESPSGRLTDSTGRITEMMQLGWRVRYDRWTGIATPDGEVRLPARMSATRADLRLTVVVDSWKLQLVD